MRNREEKRLKPALNPVGERYTLYMPPSTHPERYTLVYMPPTYPGRYTLVYMPPFHTLPGTPLGIHHPSCRTGCQRSTAAGVRAEPWAQSGRKAWARALREVKVLKGVTDGVHARARARALSGENYQMIG